MNGSVLPGSAEVVEVVLGVALLVAVVAGAVLVPLGAVLVPLGAELEVDELPDEVPVELVELLFELAGDEFDEELGGGLEGFVQVASGSTYCWLPADGVHASAAELVVSPSASATRMPMTIWEERLTARIQAMLEKKRGVIVLHPSNLAALQ